MKHYKSNSKKKSSKQAPLKNKKLIIAFITSAFLGIIPFFHLLFVAILYSVIDPGPEKFVVMSILPLYLFQPFILVFASILGFILSIITVSLNKTMLRILSFLLLCAGAFLVAYYYSLNILFS